MAIKGRDKYETVSRQSGSIELSRRLAVLYGPLMGGEAVDLYLLLFAESSQPQAQPVSRLCQLSLLTINQLEKALKQLESFQLIKTLFKTDANGDLYRFELYQPLGFDAFLRHEVFGRIYLKAVGTAQFTITQQCYTNQELAEQGFKDVSACMEPSLLGGWDENDEKTFKAVCHDYRGESLQLQQQFDMESFLANLTELMFPRRLRTKENLRIIGEMATVFGIDPEAMAKIVSRSTDIDTGTFDIDNLHERCLKAKTVAVPTPQEPYDMAPAQFLCNLQQGKSVAMADKKLLEYLQTELKMDRQVINVMVEGIIKHCNGRLDKAYVEKVATSWIRQPITNVDQAKEAVGNMTTTNTRRSSRQKRPDFAPDDYSQNTTDFGQLQDQLFKKE